MDGPTNSNLALMIGNLGEKIGTQHEANQAEHASILVQCVATNGRVTDLEKLKNMVMGGLLLTNLIILPTIFILLSKYL